MADDSINIDLAQDQPEQPINIDTATTPQLPNNIAAQRAFKAKIGMPSFEMGVDEIAQRIASGKEDDVRQQAAAHMNLQKELMKSNIITEFATAQKGPISPDQLKQIQGSFKALDHPTDPKSAFEEYWSQEYMNALEDAAKRNPDSEVAAEMRDDYNRFVNYKSLGSAATAYKEFTTTLRQNLEAEAEAQTWVGWGVDRAKELFPGYTDVKMRGFQGGFFSAGATLGTNLQQQAQNYLNLPFNEFTAKLTADVTRLKKDNPALAVELVKAVEGMSLSDIGWKNFTTVVDVATVGSSKLLAKGIKALIPKSATEKAAEQMVKATADPVMSRATIHDATGDLKEAAIAKVSEDIAAQIKGLPLPTQRGVESLQSFFKSQADAIEAGSAGLSRELVNRLKDQVYARANDTINLILNTMRVERIPGVLASEKAVREIIDQAKTKLPSLDNSILDIRTNLQKDPITGQHYVEFQLGQNDGRLFSNEKAAKTFINKHGLEGAVPVGEDVVQGVAKDFTVQKGIGYYIRVPIGINETDSVVRDALLFTKESQTPRSVLNAWGKFVGSLRTPEEVLSFNQNLNRHVAAYAPSKFLELSKKYVEDLNALNKWKWVPFSDAKKKWTEWERVTDFSRNKFNDPITGEKRMFESPSELSQHYQNLVRRAPDEQEIKAYFDFKGQMETLDVYRNNRVYANKSRIGARTYTVSATDPLRETAKSAPFKNATFDAVKIPSLKNIGDDTIVFIGDSADDVLVSHTKKMSGKRWEDLGSQIETGAKVLLRIINPEDRPLIGFSDHISDTVRPRYVIANAVVDGGPRVKDGTLSWNQVFNKPRPAEMEHDFYIKQANMRFDEVSKTHWYEGDNTLAAFNIRAMGTEVSNALDKMRLLVKEGYIEEARKLNPLPIDAEEVLGWFSPTIKNGKNVPARLSLDHRIQVVPRNKMISDIDDSLSRLDGFKNGTTEGYGRYFEPKADPHEIFEFRNEGTKANPLYKVEPAKLIDPITSVNRALNKVIEQTFMDDYKIFSVEHWIQEAKKHLNASLQDIEANPFYYFFNGKFRSGADLTTVNNLEVARFQIRQFLGITNETSASIQDFTQILADSIYNKTGSSSLALAPMHLLPMVKDPVAAIRGFTFHAKLGLFNPAQLLTQLQTFANIYGIAGTRYAAPGTKAALLHYWSSFNMTPEFLAKLDQLATKQIIPGTAQFKPGWFTEAKGLLDNSGFGKSGIEHALNKDNPLGYKAIGGAIGNFLDMGTFFFSAGENRVRAGAYYTAYLEFRDKFPTKVITEADKRELLNRADLFNANMSRASNSRIQSGLMSVPTQFLTYQIRVAEMMIGKRLNSTEKMRLFGTYATLYGVPSALGLSGLPAADLINQYTIEHGHTRGASYLADALSDGLPALTAALITGNHYNVGEKYGVQGLDVIRESMAGDKAWWELAGGASYSTFAGTLKSASPLFNWVANMWRDEGSQFTVTADHFGQMFKEISGVNKAWQVYAAVNTGKWYSKNNNYLGDATPVDAAFMYLTGLQHTEFSEAYKQQEAGKSQDSYNKYTEGRFIEEYRRGLRVYKDNPNQGDQYFANARAWLKIRDYPLQRYGDIYSIASKDYESYVARMERQFHLDPKKIPASMQVDRRKQFEEKYRLREGNK